MWLIIGFILIVLFCTFSKEDFMGTYVYGFPSRINRPTRNMSYDLRGEEYYPPLLNLPFDNSSIAPKYP
jgi:hypothetical protein